MLDRLPHLVREIIGGRVAAKKANFLQLGAELLKGRELLQICVPPNRLVRKPDVNRLARIVRALDLLGRPGYCFLCRLAEAGIEQGDDYVRLVDGLLVNDALRSPTKHWNTVFLPQPWQQDRPLGLRSRGIPANDGRLHRAALNRRVTRRSDQNL